VTLFIGSNSVSYLMGPEEQRGNLGMPEYAFLSPLLMLYFSVSIT